MGFVGACCADWSGGFVREFDGLFVEYTPFVDIAGVRFRGHTRFDVVRAVRGISPRVHREHSEHYSRFL